MKMEGRDFQIYNKCLFKGIDYCALKSELIERKIDFSPSDTYHILTLRLRKEILKCYPDQKFLLDNVQQELDNYNENKHKGGSRYICKIPGCPFNSVNYRKYLSHLDMVHRSSKSRFVCQYRHQCSREFQSLILLKNHISRDHSNKTTTVEMNQNQLVVELTIIKCAEQSCGHQSVSSIPELKKHLYSAHTDKKEEIQCIFCTYKSNTTSTLQSHISRKHKVQTVNTLTPNLVKIREDQDEGERGTEGEAFEENSAEIDFDSLDISVDGVYEDIWNEDIYEDRDELFVKAVAIMFNSWMNVKGIAWSTVNAIVQEVFESYNKGVVFTKRKIRSRMLADGVETETIENALNILDDEDPFMLARKELEKESKRKKFICSSFPHVQPVTVQLNSIREEKAETMQYVPIKDSVKLLLEDQTYIEQKNEDPYFSQAGVVKDIRDGTCYRENEFFKINPDAVPLIVFIDELEVCNPLGSGKSRHKINCTYFTSADIQPALRTKVNSIQLISLVLSRYWKRHGNAACNKNFIDDMKLLEEDGVQILKPCEKIVKVGLAYVVGDNLGQHSLAEMSTSFSSGFICRWCQVDYKAVCQEGKCYKGCQEGFDPVEWTVEEYDRMAKKAVTEEGAETLGIKGECTFNQLKSFHCIKQLPPCLGHDFYEGVYSYDIQFCLDYIINKEKLIRAQDFNDKLKYFKLSERDRKNRPKDFKTRKKNSKYEGNAGSLRILSRILTMCLSTVLDQSEVGELIIKL